jgi:hypothetical protein
MICEPTVLYQRNDMSTKKRNQKIPVQTKQEFQEFFFRFKTDDSLIPTSEVVRDQAIFPPDIDDLYRLYRLVRDTAVISAIEYGSGWSTFALSKGIWENKESFGDNYIGYRNLNAFKLKTVDASSFFLKKAINRIPISYQSVVLSQVATPKLVTEYNQCSVMWTPVQRVDYDLIYIDGPEPEQVVREQTEFPISTIYDLPIMGDLVRYESYILPSTLILFDGRTSNFRHFKRHFSRDWKYVSNLQSDYSLMCLNESPIGSINAQHLDFREKHSQASLKEIESWGMSIGEN